MPELMTGTQIRSDDERSKENAITKHKTGTREDWFAARLELLKADSRQYFGQSEAAIRVVGKTVRL
jgi:hypothetical protein